MIEAKIITWCHFAFQELFSLLTKMSITFVFIQNRFFLRVADIQRCIFVVMTQWALQTLATFDSLKITMCQMLLEEATSLISLRPRIVLRLSGSEIALILVLFFSFNCCLLFKMILSTEFLMEL